MNARRGGRPTKFSLMVGDEIIDHLLEGVPRREIPARVGIGRRTLQDWLRRGRAGEPPFAARAERFDRVANALDRRRAWASAERERAAAKERWQRFKAARGRWWRERLGPAEFWRRRLAWLAERGHWDAYRRTIERLRSEGFRTNAPL